MSNASLSVNLISRQLFLEPSYLKYNLQRKQQSTGVKKHVSLTESHINDSVAGLALARLLTVPDVQNLTIGQNYDFRSYISIIEISKILGKVFAQK